MGYPFQYKSFKVVLARKKYDHFYQNNQNQFLPYSPGKPKEIPLGGLLLKCENIVMVEKLTNYSSSM